MLLARAGTIFIKHIVSMVIERPRCIASLARGVSVSLKEEILVAAGEPLAELCREFGFSRKTGYKIFDRYQECGIQGLTDRSRRPYRYANQLPFQVENFILNVKHEHPAGVLEKSASA